MRDRELTPDTKWIVCMWDIKGEDIIETAMLLKRSIRQIKQIIRDCKADGYYDMVRRHIDYFDTVNARYALEGFASALKGDGGGVDYER